jgi:CRP-like cAMP-binding protein
VGVQPTVTVDTLILDVVPADTFLLCSDGLYQYFEDARELAQLLGQAGPEGVAGQLVEVANERGGDDNISALVVRARADDPKVQMRQTQVNQNLQALRYIALFMDMSMAELCRVFNAFRPVEFARGDQVIREGEQSDGLFVVVDGEVSVSRKNAELARLGAGSHFGEMALLNQRPRSATVTATQPSRLLVLERASFNDLLQSDAPTACKFLYKLAQTLSLRLDDANIVQDAEAARRTLELGVLSPFSRRN